MADHALATADRNAFPKKWQDEPDRTDLFVLNGWMLYGTDLAMTSRTQQPKLIANGGEVGSWQHLGIDDVYNNLGFEVECGLRGARYELQPCVGGRG
jgi:hypothetical protein